MEWVGLEETLQIIQTEGWVTFHWSRLLQALSWNTSLALGTWWRWGSPHRT